MTFINFFFFLILRVGCAILDHVLSFYFSDITKVSKIKQMTKLLHRNHCLMTPKSTLPWDTGGRSGGAMVLGKLSVPGRPTNLDYSSARAYCACSRCRWGCLDIFLSSAFSFLSSSLWETARYRLKYCLKGPSSPRTTNQPTLGTLTNEFSI